MKEDFDLVAQSYISADPELSSEFVCAVVRHFRIAGGDRVLELGCGCGSLSLALAGRGADVDALDSSPTMIQACKAADLDSRVRWHQSRVEEYNFATGVYRLIISYESFHLFEKSGQLLHGITDALEPQGQFCVAWCDYYWQEPLREIILSVFAKFGISWEEWGYQRCPFLKELVAAEVPALSFGEQVPALVQSRWSSDRIALFLSSIGKTVHLRESERAELRSQLEADIAAAAVPASGYSEYCLQCWCRSAGK